MPSRSKFHPSLLALWQGQAIQRRTVMRNYICTAKLVFGILSLTALGSAPLDVAFAHGDEKMECTEASMNAMTADVQAMNDGDAKTTAMKEMQVAKDMMAKKDMEACMSHMHNAMEATEK
jgi:hypothetical protein